MTETIKVEISAKVANGPAISAVRSISVEAYDLISATVPGGASGTPGTATIQVQPPAASGAEMILITSATYDDNLTYSVLGGSTGAADVVVDGPQLFVGSGTAALLGGTAPFRLEFKNGTGDGNDITVSILAGRDATP